MNNSDVPTPFPIPFAANAGADYVRAIPTNHVDASATDAPASLNDGFPPETFLPLASGGVPVNGKDMNGILHRATAWARWMAAGGPIVFNSDFAAAIGGYPKGALIQSTTPGKVYASTANGNTTDPDGSSAANWIVVTADFGAAANDYYFLPNGKVEQWGYVATSSTGEPVLSVSLAIEMVDAAYNVSLTPSINGATQLADTWVQIIRNTKTTTGFSVQYQHVASGSSSTPGLDGFEWRVVGRRK